ncbi:MAG: ATP-binding protein, partial [Candidatus Omnitrophica bacterium]|nr:ATP-binding protein [Candidatus Omnitrophota bacterium]
MALKPWYDVVKPREDLCQGKPLDAAEFAVHLDQIRDGRAPDVYCNPSLFFERTYLTKTLTSLAGEVVRRLSGEMTETSAVFNMTTQFGGGKTHGLTLLYHLARSGNKAKRFYGVQNIIEKAGVSSIPEAAVAVFVGTEFDAVKGRGGDDGTPHRQTPWGEIAYQIGGEKAFSLVAKHDQDRIEPKGDVIRKMIPEDRPCLILMDEMLSYFSSYRRQGYSSSLYNFIQALSETVRGCKNAVLVASLPASEIEYNPDDQADEDRLKKMLDRLGKAIMMSAEAETAEIIRRRLFDWEEGERDLSGKIYLNKDAAKTCDAYADWIRDHRQQVPQWFANDDPANQFKTTYPFHPSVLSVFERKWQSLPKFQRTRGVLRLLAQWVAKDYEKGMRRDHKNPLIHMGSAPLSDSMFRAAIMEQVGSDRIEAPLMTDIAGGERAHAWKLDKEAVDSIRKTKLHVGTATSIFFESTGGGTREAASLPELRLALGSPHVDVGNVETVLEGLSNDCYYLISENNQYRFSIKPNLNKLLSDRISDVKDDAIREQVRSYVQKGFVAHGGVYVHPFPSKT